MNWNRTPWPVVHTPESVASHFSKITGESERRSIAELLNFIECPESLQGIIPVLGCLEGIIDKATEEIIGSKPALHSKLNELTAAIGLLRDSIEECLDENQSFASTSTTGLCGTNPLYAVLVNFGAFETPVDMTQSLVALFYLKYRKYWQQMNPDIRRNAGLAFRSTFSAHGFGATARFRAFYKSLELDQVDDLIQSLKEQDLDDLRRRVRDHVKEMILLFEGSLGKGKGRSGGGRSGGSRRRLERLNKSKTIHSQPMGLSSSDDEEEEDHNFGNLQHHVGIGEKSVDQSKDLGLEEKEIDSGREAISEKFKDEKKAVMMQDVMRQKFRATQVAKAIAMKNLFLPNDWDQLNFYDLYVLLKELHALSCEDEYAGVNAAKLAALLTLCFLRGAPVDQVWNCKVVFQHRKSYFNHVLFKEVDGNWHASWLIGVRDNGTRIKKGGLRGELHLLQKEASQLVLEAPFWAAQIVRTAVRKIGKASKIFSGSQDQFSEAARSWIRETNKKNPGSRISLGRIEKYLLQIAMQAPDIDLAEAAYAHGYDHPVFRTQLYYTTIQVSRIQDHYIKLCQQIELAVERERKAQKKEPFIAKGKIKQSEMGAFIDGDIRVGSKITPTNKAVKKLRKHCEQMKDFMEEVAKDAAKDSMEEAMKNLSWKRLTEYHNAYVTYTLMLLAYSSGYRAVCDPLPDPRFVDRKTQFCVISDKDHEDAYCTRVVWLSDIFIQQLDYYDEHIRSLRQHLPLIDMKGFKRLAEQDQEREKAYVARKKGRITDYPSPPYLFCFNDQGKVESIRPSWIESRVEKEFPFPVNANRHYLRTNLVLNKCPKDTVDAFMGHWHRGREPWGTYSSLSPMAYSSDLQSYMDKLNEGIKWKAIRSKSL